MPIDPQQIAQRIIDTIARTQGGSSSNDESFVVNERVIRDRHVRGNKPPQLSPKLGYVYRKVVTDITPLFCSSEGSPSNQPQQFGPSNGNYNPVPTDQSRTIRVEITQVDGTLTYSNADGTFTIQLGTGLEFVLPSTATYTMFSTDALSYREEVPETFERGGIGSVVVWTLTRTNLYLGNSPIGTVKVVANLIGYDRITGAADGYVALLTEIGSSIITGLDGPIRPAPGDPNNPPNPNNPPSPDPTRSVEFYYSGSNSTSPIKLKSLSFNQPLEAKPYILHSTTSKSYVVLKYGKAGNDNGSNDDWCKISLFEIKGTKNLTVAETIYSWTQESAAQAKLKKAKTLFYAIAGSKTKQENLNINNLVTTGKLSAKLRCFTHRNLSNLKQNVYVIDPILGEDSNLDDLFGDAVYEYGAISNLVADPQTLVNLRYFELEPNPSFNAGATEDCRANQAYRLVEKPKKKIKRVKLKGLNSNDSSIKILTLNCGLV